MVDILHLCFLYSHHLLFWYYGEKFSHYSEFEGLMWIFEVLKVQLKGCRLQKVLKFGLQYWIKVVDILHLCFLYSHHLLFWYYGEKFSYNSKFEGLMWIFEVLKEFLKLFPIKGTNPNYWHSKILKSYIFVAGTSWERSRMWILGTWLEGVAIFSAWGCTSLRALAW